MGSYPPGAEINHSLASLGREIKIFCITNDVKRMIFDISYMLNDNVVEGVVFILYYDLSKLTLITTMVLQEICDGYGCSNLSSQL